jgi:hypothetical protein
MEDDNPDLERIRNSLENIGKTGEGADTETKITGCKLEERIRNTGLAERNNLYDIREICAGIAMASRKWMIGTDDIGVKEDRVLIEEIKFDSESDVRANKNGMQRKAEIFRDYSFSSTPPLIDWKNPEKTNTVYIVHPTPGITLGEFLKRINEASAPKYNYDHLAFFGAWWKKKNEYKEDMIKKLQHSREGKKGRKLNGLRNFIGTLISTPKAYSSAWKDFLGQEPRKKLARRLLDEINKKHKRTIDAKNPLYHNNISLETVFIQDNFRIMFLSNYSGKESEILKKYIPNKILNATNDCSFGKETNDVYSLAALLYPVLTGEMFDSRLFRMDNQSSAKVSKATGGFIRSVPVIGSIMNRLFPTKYAIVMRNVLDDKCNEKKFGLLSKTNINREEKKNADLDYVISAFDVKDPDNNEALEEFAEKKQIFREKRKGYGAEYKKRGITSGSSYLRKKRMLSTARTAAVTLGIAGIAYVGSVIGLEYRIFDGILNLNQNKNGDLIRKAGQTTQKAVIPKTSSVKAAEPKAADTTATTSIDSIAAKEITETADSRAKDNIPAIPKITRNRAPYPVAEHSIGGIPVYNLKIGEPFNLIGRFKDPDQNDYVDSLKLVDCKNKDIYLDNKGYINFLPTVRRSEIRNKKLKISVEAWDNRGNKKPSKVYLSCVEPFPFLIKTKIEGVYEIINAGGESNLGNVWDDGKNTSLGEEADSRTEYCTMTIREGKYVVSTVYENQNDHKFYDENDIEYRIKNGDKFCFYSRENRKKLNTLRDAKNLELGVSK